MFPHDDRAGGSGGGGALGAENAAPDVGPCGREAPGDRVPQHGSLYSWERVEFLGVWDLIGQELGLGSGSLECFFKVSHSLT